MNLINLVIIISISTSTLFLLKHDEKKGICFLIFFLIVMPRELSVQLGGSFPTLTGYRAIMIVLIFYFLFLRERLEFKVNTPFLGLLSLLLVQKSLSLFLAYDFGVSLKGLSVFVLEVLIFYVILVKIITKTDNIENVVGSVAFAIIVISIIGFIEKYTQFNLVDYISSSGHPRFDPINSNAVYSTFSHPIHFGYSLAMGWAVCLYVLNKQRSLCKKRLILTCLLLLYAGLYFSYSRGAWLGFVLAAMVLWKFKYPRFKIIAAQILIVTALFLVLRPGVYYSIKGLSASTLNDESVEGGSFLYRFELLKKAFREISKSPERLAFGYGDGAHHAMVLRDRVSYGSNRENRFWSWDNEFALILLEGGFFGLIVNITLYLSILLYLTRRIKFLQDKKRNIMIAVISSVTVFVFMMSNVAIFSPSLHFIMWICVSIGVTLAQDNDTEFISSQEAAAT